MQDLHQYPLREYLNIKQPEGCRLSKLGPNGTAAWSGAGVVFELIEEGAYAKLHLFLIGDQYLVIENEILQFLSDSTGCHSNRTLGWQA